MYKNFSNKAQKVIITAETIAKEYGFKQIEPLFLLLAFIYLGKTPTVTLFQKKTFKNVTIEYIIFNEFYGIDILDYEKKSITSKEFKTSKDFEASKDIIEPSTSLKLILQAARINSEFYNNKEVTLENLLFALFDSTEYNFENFLNTFIIDQYTFKISLLNSLKKQGENIEEIIEWHLGNTEEIKCIKDRDKVNQANQGELSPTHISKELEDVKKFTTNITKLAANKNLDPIIGRDKEIRSIYQILSRQTRNNPILIGEPGVGKSSIINGLALFLNQGFVPDFLKDKVLVQIHIGAILDSAKQEDEFKNRLKAILNRLTASGKVILVFDELHMLGKSEEGDYNITSILKPFLLNKDVQFIGSISTDDYNKSIKSDIPLTRRFQLVQVEEATVLDTILILRHLKQNYEKFHKIRYTDAAIVAAAKLSSEHIADRFLPDKAIDLLDEAGANVRLESCVIPEEYYIIKQQLKVLREYNEQDSEGYRELNAKYLDFNNKSLSVATRNADKERVLAGTSKSLIVHESDVAEIVSLSTGIPVSKISKRESEQLLKMEDTLHQRIIGQHQAVVSVSKAIRRARIGLRDPNRPIASFIFAGPTGVGKTELTKALAFSFFGSEKNMIRLDMSEYMERHTVAKLIGSPPGYIGYSEGGQLTEAVRKKPYTVILFDEVEKAHPDVFNLLLQVLEDGHLTDSKGLTVSFKNTLIILTSNVGAKVIENTTSQFADIILGEGQDNSIYKRIWKLVNKELKNKFKPEFLNRLDEIIIFSQLTKDDISQIADILINKLVERLWDQNGFILIVTDRVRKKLIDEGFDPVYGARPLRRAATSILEDNLAIALIGTEVKPESEVIIDIGSDNKIVVSINEEVE